MRKDQDKTETPKHKDLPHFWAFVEQINRKKTTTKQREGKGNGKHK